MLGASALCGHAAMRAGAGLVTLAVPKSLNASLHKKISSVIMTLPLKETSSQTFSFAAYMELRRKLKNYTAIVIGPGLSENPSTQRFIYKIIESAIQPLVIDADALNAVAKNLRYLKKTKREMILTPHPGEMARLISKSKAPIEKTRVKQAKNFAKKYGCTLILKGHQTIVAHPQMKSYMNETGNPGMATAGSGDVLAGIVGAFLAQGLSSFQAAKWATYIHGKAGDIAAKAKSKAAMIATDIIDNIPEAIKKSH